MTAAASEPSASVTCLPASAQKLSARLAYSLRIDRPSQPPESEQQPDARGHGRQRADPRARR